MRILVNTNSWSSNCWVEFPYPARERTSHCRMKLNAFGIRRVPALDMVIPLLASTASAKVEYRPTTQYIVLTEAFARSDPSGIY